MRATTVMVLRETPDSIRRFLDNLPAEMGVRPEAPGTWSIRDVVQHRADAELVDGFRLRMILARDRPALAGYDQDLWASRLGYNVVQLEEAFEQFAVLLRSNMRIWERLTPSDLARAGIHAERGEESLGLMLRLCAGHDRLHLRQLETDSRGADAQSVRHSWMH